MVEACIILIITYAGETRNLTNKGKTELNRSLDRIIKIILLVPTSTPRDALYIETGIMDIEHTTMKNRLNMDKRLKTNPNSLTSKVKDQRSGNKERMETKNWRHKKAPQINPTDIEGTKNQTKGENQNQSRKCTKKSLTTTGKDK